MAYYSADAITIGFFCFFFCDVVNGDSIWPVGFSHLNTSSLSIYWNNKPSRTWKGVCSSMEPFVPRSAKDFKVTVLNDIKLFKTQLATLQVVSEEVNAKLQTESGDKELLLQVLHDKYADYDFNMMVNTNDHNRIPKPKARQKSFSAKTFEEFCKVSRSHGFTIADFPEHLIRELTNQTISQPECDPLYKYRITDGSCNNLEHPTWVEAPHRFDRLLKPVYEDGISEPRGGKDGKKLPNARAISTLIARDVNRPDDERSLTFVYFGQFIAHDITFTPADQPALGEDNVISCCDPEAIELEQCFAIDISPDDYFYGVLNVTCMDLARSLPAPADEDPLTDYREQMNQNTAIIDGSLIYGPDDETEEELRLFEHGFLRTEEVHGQQVCMFSREPEKDRCSTPESGHICSIAGDSRSNQNLVLASFHIMWLREHNRIAAKLAELNPTWDDETLFQESKRIVVAELQHITFSHYLPLLIGSETMEKYELEPLTFGYTKYDSSIKANLLNEFSTGFFRLHTLVNNTFQLYDENYEDKNQTVHLKGTFFKPFLVYNNSLEFIQGISQAYCQEKDTFHGNEMTNRLYSTSPTQAMFDIVAINIQRGRDHGLPPFVDYVKKILDISLETWDDLKFWFSRRELDWLRKLYKNVSEIDLYVGLLMEPRIGDGAVGATQSELIGYQFHRLKYGDRFYYEHDEVGGFTPAQLATIRETTTLGRVFRDNYPEITRLKEDLFALDSPLVDPSHFPDLDLELWRENSHNCPQ